MHGFSAIFRRGVWTYQKFHHEAEAKALAPAFIGPIEKFSNTKSSWQVCARKAVEPSRREVEQALEREFNLPWPGGKTVGMGAKAVEAWRCAAGLS